MKTSSTGLALTAAALSAGLAACNDDTVPPIRQNAKPEIIATYKLGRAHVTEFRSVSDPNRIVIDVNYNSASATDSWKHIGPLKPSNPVFEAQYSIGRHIDVMEFTPASAPDRLCIYVDEPDAAGLTCDLK